MYLLVDAGNSSIKWNIYDSTLKQFLLPRQSFLWRTDDLLSLLDQQWRGLNSIGAVLIANVAGHEVQETVQQWLSRRQLQAKIINTESNAFGVRNAYKIPAQLGVDRWLAVLAAANSLPGQNICTVSCGTAITVDTVTAAGDHLGGLIIPGSRMMKKALLQHTHGVKIAPTEASWSPFSDSTSAAVNHGVLFAALGFIDRAIAAIESELDGEVTKMITGGDAQTIREHSRYTFMHEPQLVLKGLALYADENT